MATWRAATMTTVTEDPARRRRQILAFALFLVAYLVTGLATMENSHAWGDDWAQYVLHARNLLTAHAYTDTGYIFNPDFPWAGPGAYPPGTSVMLLPALAIAGVQLYALKVPIFLALFLALPVAMRVISPALGFAAASMGVMLAGMHPAYWNVHGNIGSEAPYLLASVVALWWAQRPVPTGMRRAFVSGMMAGVLVAGAILCRSIGVALVPAVLVHGWAQRRHWAWFLGFALALGACVGLVSWMVAPPPTYEGELRAPTVSRVVGQQPQGYWDVVVHMFPFPFSLSKLSAAAFLVTAVAGILYAIARAPRGSGLRGQAARVPIVAWYLGAYVSALLLASVEPNRRLVMPILPLLVPFAVAGVQRTLDRWDYGRPVLAGLAISAVAYVLGLNVVHQVAPEGQTVMCGECRDMFAFVRKHTPRGSVVVFNKARTMALLGERRSWVPAPRYTLEQFAKRAERFGADYVVAGTPGAEFEQRYPLAPAVRQRLAQPDVQRVFHNAEFEVFRLGSPAPK